MPSRIRRTLETHTHRSHTNIRTYKKWENLSMTKLSRMNLLYIEKVDEDDDDDVKCLTGGVCRRTIVRA
jgi:hypothetical protein